MHDEGYLAKKFRTGCPKLKWLNGTNIEFIHNSDEGTWARGIEKSEDSSNILCSNLSDVGSYNDSKGAFEYYISAFGGGGGSGQVC